MAWNGTYKVKQRRRKISRKLKLRSKKTKKVQRRRRAPRKHSARQVGGKGSAALLSGYLGYPVTGKVPSIEIGDVDSVPTVMSKDDYEELKDEL